MRLIDSGTVYNGNYHIFAQDRAQRESGGNFAGIDNNAWNNGYFLLADGLSANNNYGGLGFEFLFFDPMKVKYTMTFISGNTYYYRDDNIWRNRYLGWFYKC